MLSVLVTGLVFASAGIMFAALFPLRRLVRQLPDGPVRTKWNVLSGLVVVFIAGYIGYALMTWERVWSGEHFMVPSIFFLGACFVWVSAMLALQTADDVRRVSRLEYENITDPLTGTFNRRYMQRRLDEEFALARRYGVPLTLLLLDIDHFKRVNDTHGHQVGDLVLRRLGQEIQNAVRDTDVVARYGGEEFMIIAPGSPLSDARLLAERIRGTAAAQELALGGDRRLKVTVSIGAVCLGPSIVSAEALVRAADEALYEAKNAGRDRAVIRDAY